LALMSQGAQVLARRADRTVVPSVTLARELVAAGISRASISVIAPGKDASAPSSSKSAGRVLCVANWSPAKGIHTLVSAIASVRAPTPCARSRETANCATACDRARCAAHAPSRHGGAARPRSCDSCARSLLAPEGAARLPRAALVCDELQ